MSGPSAAATRSSTSRDLEEVLSGRLGVHALRRLVVDPVEGHPLSSAGPVELLRTKYKPGRKLSGFYRWGTTRRPQLAAMTWHADGRTSALAWPTDPAMPQLAQVVERARLAEMLTGLTGEPVCRSPRELTVRPIRYRPGERHVLHVRGGLLGPAGMYLKLDRDASGERSVPVAVSLATQLAGQPAVASPVGYVGAERVAVWHGAPGRPLWQPLWDGSQDGAGLVRAVGQGLRALHAARLRVERSHSVPAEAEATRRAGEHIAALLPREGELFETLVSTVLVALERWRAEPDTVVHGDVKCDNLLASEDQQVRFLDLDRVALAEPALDLGKFLADLQWWCPESRLPALRSALRAGYGPCDEARWARAELLAVLLGAKLVARRCALHDPAWEETVRARLARVVVALETVGREP